ncbi:hypothetical protein D3C86_1937600 [compost metagenome]
MVNTEYQKLPSAPALRATTAAQRGSAWVAAACAALAEGVERVGMTAVLLKGRARAWALLWRAFRFILLGSQGGCDAMHSRDGMRWAHSEACF